MCGINGYITKKKHSRFAQERFERILVEGETRGTDASGIGFIKSKQSFYYAKAPMKASKFITKEKYKQLIEKFDPSILIGHNRQKTQGDKENNYNNHPIVTKTGLVLIHNGIIHNDDQLFKQYKLARDGEVDTEIIVRMIEYYLLSKGLSVTKAIQSATKEIRGSMAVALLYAKEPRSMYLFRSSNPLNLAFHKPTGTIFFSSTEHILESGVAEHKWHFKGLFHEEIPNDNYIFYELEDDTGIKITPKGWTSFKIERPEIESNYYSRDNRYSNGQRGFSFSNANNPLVIEQGDDEDIKKAVLDESDTFSVMEKIDKPSDYLTEHILLRLEHIQDMLMNNDWEAFYGTTKGEGGLKRELTHEVHSLCQTIKARAEMTKREVVIPDPKEILDLLEKPNEAIKLPLTQMNDHLIAKYTEEEMKEFYDTFDFPN